MSLAPHSRIGPYEIIAPLGAGGMGEVYRARDTSLGREVALKVLPDAFASDPDRLARFEREAKALAALNHPNIAQVYGFEQGPAGHQIGTDVAPGLNRTTALVMELLEGETLRDRLRDGALPLRKAIDCGAQIARGLAAAHERGIIHRDLKPENVFVLTDGRVKILDFGLARQIEAPGSGATQTRAVMGGTDPGVVMGTVGYMAPEQVRGATLDARADLFALGALLYEMLSGHRAFQRDTAAESMTAILKDDVPELTASRADLSPALDRIVRHCLEKNPIERFQTARDVAFALDSLSGAGSGSGATVAAPAPAPKAARGERWIWAGVTAALVGALAWQILDQRTTGARGSSPSRFTLMLPDGVRLNDVIAAPARLSLSPDGDKLAFIGTDTANRRALWLHALRDPAARKIDDTNTAAGPTWSPDGKWILFGVFNPSGTLLRKISIDGGVPITISDRAGWAAWGPDDTILIEPVRGEPVLLRTTSAGGGLIPLQPKIVDGGSFGHLSFLPDGRHFLHRFMPPGMPRTVRTYVGSLDSADRHLVISGDDVSQAVLANDLLVFARNGTLFAQHFDTTAFKLTGDPVVIAEGVEQVLVGAAFTVSRNGILAYQPKSANFGSRLKWVDRTGISLNSVADDADYSNLELSPDGRRMLVSVREPGASTRDIYIVDTVRGVRQRLTFDPSDERSAVWSSDGTSVIYSSKGLDLYRRSAGFTGGETAVQTNHLSKDPGDVSRDGRRLVYRESSSESNDIWSMALDGSGQPQKVMSSAFNENSARFSPDGRSVVFVSDDSGRPEVYVISLEPGGGKAQLSTDGGASPRWRRDGKEIVYLNAEHTMMSVPVMGSGAAFEAGTPSPLFAVDYIPSAGSIFDMTPDGQRFIVNTAVPSRVPPHVVVILNWPALMKR